MGAADASRGSDPSSAQWTRIAERGSIWGIRFTAWMYRILGRRLTLPLIYVVVTYFFLTDPAGRRASQAYLRRVRDQPAGRNHFPDPPGLLASYRHYRTFALCIVDRMSIWLGGEEEVEFATHGLALVDRLAAEGRGALILGSHLGSFDALRLLARRSNTVVNVLMFRANAQRINRIFAEIDPDAEAQVISVDPHSVHSVFTIRERLRRGEHVAILADRIEAGDRDRAHPVSLLGGTAQLPQAPFLLAALLGCPLFSVVALREGPGRYRAFFDLLSERVKLPRTGREEALGALMTDYALRLEHYCLLHPYQWFNFFDYWGDAGMNAPSRSSDDTGKEIG